MVCERITIAGVQISQVMSSWEANISMATQASTVSRGQDIYVLPELSSSGCGADVLQALEDLGEDFRGPSFIAFPGQSITKYNEELSQFNTSIHEQQ